MPFPEARLLGTVTGFCPAFADIDIATVFTATIAHHMTVVARGTPTLPGWHRDGYELAVPGMEQAAAQARRLSDEVAWESHADQVSLRDGGGRCQAAAPRPFSLHLPPVETHADTLGVSSEHQGTPLSPHG